MTQNGTVPDQENVPSWITRLSGFFLPLSLATNCVSLIYILFQLKVNRYVQTLLKLDAGFKVGCMIICNLAFFLLRGLDFDLLMVCSLIIMSEVAAMISSFIFQPAVAVIRYHLANSTASQRLPKPWFLNLISSTATLAAIILCTTFAVYVFYLEVPFGPVIDACFKNSNSSEAPRFGPVITMSICAASLLIGLVYDIKMYRFLKERQKRVQPGIALVAWKHEVPAVSYGTKAALKATVPIQATGLGALNLMVIISIVLIMNQGLGLTSFLPYIMRTVILVADTLHMPLVLLLTVKSNSKKATISQQIHPPAELQFHD